MTKGPTFTRVNFASRDYRLLSKIFWSMVASSVVLLIALSVMMRAAFSNYASAAAFDRKLTELTVRDNAIKPVLLEREQFLKDVSTMSGIIESRRFSWTWLLTSVEAVFPPGAALERMAFNPKDSILSLEGRARSPEALRNLIVGLEKSVSFRDALLVHQSVENGIISFTVTAKYHETKDAGLAQAK